MKVEGEYIAINELYGSIDGHRTSIAKSLMYNNKQARHAVLGGVVVYDHWITTLEAFDFTSTASGGNVKDLIDVSSYGVDFKNVKHDMDYTLVPSVIPANTSTSSKTHSVEITQKNTGKKISVICTQAAAAITWTIEATLSVGSASAKGGNVSTSVSWVRYKNGVRYDSGTTTPSSISGYANGSYGSYITGTSVYVPNAGTNTSQPIVFTITDYSFYVDGEKYDRSTTTYVKLGYNTYSTQYRYYTVTLTPDTKYVASYNESVGITAEATKDAYRVYTSGSESYLGEYTSDINLSSSYGTFYRNGSNVTSTTVSSGTKVIFTPYENTSSSDRTITVVGKNADNTSTSKTLSITQYKANYEFEILSTSTTSISSSGGTVQFVVKSTKNGVDVGKPTVTPSVTWARVQSIVYNDILGDRYTITISVDSYTNTSVSRSFTVLFTQAVSGEQVRSAAITQSKAQGSVDTTTAEINAWVEGTMVYYEIDFSSTKSYLDVVVKIQDSYDGYGRVYGEPKEYSITSSDRIIDFIETYEYLTFGYVVVYVDNKVVGYKNING